MNTQEGELMEIERRFLLSRFPLLQSFPLGYIQKEIVQFYVGDVRYRCEVRDDRKDFYRTVKKPLPEFSIGVLEKEESITEEDFLLNIENSDRFIWKRRVSFREGLVKWDIDTFGPFGRLVIAEAEMPSEDHFLQIPGFLGENISMEVTGVHDMSNIRMAKRCVDPLYEYNAALCLMRDTA